MSNVVQFVAPHVEKIKVRDLAPGMRVRLNPDTCATVLSVEYDGNKHMGLTTKGGYTARALLISFEDHEPLSAHPHQDAELA